MKKLFGIFKQSWFLSLLGIIAISLVIFFFGDLLNIGGFRPFSSLQSRALTIGGLSLGWLAYHAWSWWRNRNQNQQMVQKLVESAKASPDEQASEDEVQQLSENLQDALQTLQQIQRKEGKQPYLYQLPWYVIIGPPGAGKTTLLANSRLHFPLSDKYGKDALRGVGGTRNCDWWFTDEAILLDTAGRYMTQDSREAVDRAGWEGFLDLLHTHRGHQPINGALIAISIADVIQFSPEQLEQHALTIRKRIQELHERLKIRFPVYLIFTKCDLLSGFAEYFDELNGPERDQVWGMTFPWNPRAVAEGVSQFDSEFALLEERLYQQLLERLDHERSLERRQALYLFPQQFSALRAVLGNLIEKVFQDSRYHDSIMLRGVYFTSATQEGTPIDRIMASLAGNYGVSPQRLSRFSEKGKSYFINQLLQGVVFGEAGLAGTNLKLKQRLQWLQGAVALSALLLAAAAVALLLTSYFANRSFLADYQQQVVAIDQKIAALGAETRIPPYVEVLDAMRQLSLSYADQPVQVSWLARFGLSQEKALREKMDNRYENQLHKTLRPVAKGMLEQQLRQSLTGSPESMFGSLKTYLFLGGAAPQDKQIHINGVDWNGNGEAGDIADQALDNHFNNLIRKPGKYISLDENLVREARAALERINLTQLAYQNFRNASLKEASRFNFDPMQIRDLDLINRSFVRTSGTSWSDGVAGFFTQDGYQKVFLPGYRQAAQGLAENAWVLGSGRTLNDPDNVAARVFEHYQTDYIDAWDHFLGDIQAQRITGREQAKQIFLPLTAKGGNVLFRLIQEVDKQTHFTPESKEGEEAANPVTLLIPVEVERHFLRFNDWSEAGDFQAVSQLLEEIFKGLSQDNTFAKLEDNPLKNALDKLDSEADKLPLQLREMIRTLVRPTESLVQGKLEQTARDNLKQALQEKVGAFCQQNIAGFYPLKKNARAGVALADFTRFFQPGGIMDRFMEQFVTGQN
ncbi:MAG: type VI secretion system membrane subunit TssM [Thiolinea sp.]